MPYFAPKSLSSKPFNYDEKNPTQHSHACLGVEPNQSAGFFVFGLWW